MLWSSQRCINKHTHTQEGAAPERQQNLDMLDGHRTRVLILHSTERSLTLQWRGVPTRGQWHAAYRSKLIWIPVCLENNTHAVQVFIYYCHVSWVHDLFIRLSFGCCDSRAVWLLPPGGAIEPRGQKDCSGVLIKTQLSKVLCDA